jgi:hypothetical protein
MYMDWIYSGEMARNAIDGRTLILIDPYLLGDMVDDRGLRNEAMSGLQTHTCNRKRSLKPISISRIWENTAEGSLLRKWAFDRVLLKQRNTFNQDIAECPPEFVQQIAVKLMQQASNISATDFLAKTQEYQEADDEA